MPLKIIRLKIVHICSASFEFWAKEKKKLNQGRTTEALWKKKKKKNLQDVIREQKI